MISLYELEISVYVTYVCLQNAYQVKPLIGEVLLLVAVYQISHVHWAFCVESLIHLDVVFQVNLLRQPQLRLLMSAYPGWHFTQLCYLWGDGNICFAPICQTNIGFTNNLGKLMDSFQFVPQCKKWFVRHKRINKEVGELGYEQFIVAS